MGNQLTVANKRDSVGRRKISEAESEKLCDSLPEIGVGTAALAALRNARRPARKGQMPGRDFQAIWNWTNGGLISVIPCAALALRPRRSSPGATTDGYRYTTLRRVTCRARLSYRTFHACGRDAPKPAGGTPAVPGSVSTPITEHGLSDPAKRCTIRICYSLRTEHCWRLALAADCISIVL